MKILFALLLITPASMLAQTAFNGTWKTKLDSAQLPTKPEVYAVQGGRYVCSTCVPEIDIKADGSDEAVRGSHYFDTMSVKIVDPNTLEITQKKGGKTVYQEIDTVSADGGTLTEKWSDQSMGNPEPETAEESFTRISGGPTGAHLVSGSWRATKLAHASNNGLTVNIKTTVDGLKVSFPTGQSYDAKFDGKDYPIEGDPGHTMVSLKRINENTVEQTEKRDGKVVEVVRFTAGKDSKSMHVVMDDRERNEKTSFTMYKQS